MAKWQEKIDEDFPHGALFSRQDWIDPDGTPRLWRTAAVSVTKLDSAGRPVLQLWRDPFFERDWFITVLAYEQIQDDPVLLVKIRTPDPELTWALSANIPAKVWGTPGWQALRTAQRLVGLDQEIPDDVRAVLHAERLG